MAWFLFVDYELRDCADDSERKAKFDRFRDGLSDTGRREVLGFLTAASQSSDAELSRIWCPEIRNGFLLVPGNGQPLRLDFEQHLRDFLGGVASPS